MTTKQKEQQNGTVKEPAQTLDLAAAQQMIAAEQQERLRQAAVALDLFCKDRGVIVIAEPYLDDGRTRARVVIKVAQ